MGIDFAVIHKFLDSLELLLINFSLVPDLAGCAVATRNIGVFLSIEQFLVFGSCRGEGVALDLEGELVEFVLLEVSTCFCFHLLPVFHEVGMLIFLLRRLRIY